MDPVSNADRLVRLLRQKLELRNRAKRAQKTSEGQTVRQSGLDQIRLVTGEVSQAGGEPRQLHRVVVEQLLSEKFGSDLVNEPRFQQIVDQVFAIISDDADMSGLLAGVTQELSRKTG